MARGSVKPRQVLPSVVTEARASSAITSEVAPDLRDWLNAVKLNEIFELPDGAVVALGEPIRVSPGFALFPLARPWRRRVPPRTNYEIALDGSIRKNRRLDATHSESRLMPFRVGDLKQTGRCADHCIDCGAISFTTLRDRDHDASCMRP